MTDAVTDRKLLEKPNDPLQPTRLQKTAKYTMQHVRSKFITKYRKLSTPVDRPITDSLDMSKVFDPVNHGMADC